MVVQRAYFRGHLRPKPLQWRARAIHVIGYIAEEIVGLLNLGGQLRGALLHHIQKITRQHVLRRTTGGVPNCMG